MNKILLSLGIIGLISQPTSAAMYRFSADQVKISAKQQLHIHPIQANGFALLQNAVKVPIYKVGAPNGLDGSISIADRNCKSGCRFNFKLSSDIATQFKIYQFPFDNFVLVPKSWNRVEVQSGANGNTVINMQSPDGKSTLNIQEIPACYGCSIAAASIYFPEANRMNGQNKQYYTSNNANLKTVRANAQTVYFQYQLPQHYKTDGVAKYRPQGDDLFNSIRVSLPDKDKKSASAILNFYSQLH